MDNMTNSSGTNSSGTGGSNSEVWIGILVISDVLAITYIALITCVLSIVKYRASFSTRCKKIWPCALLTGINIILVISVWFIMVNIAITPLCSLPSADDCSESIATWLYLAINLSMGLILTTFWVAMLFIRHRCARRTRQKSVDKRNNTKTVSGKPLHLPSVDLGNDDMIYRSRITKRIQGPGSRPKLLALSPPSAREVNPDSKHQSEIELDNLKLDNNDKIVVNSNQKCGLSIKPGVEHLGICTVQNEIVLGKSHHISRDLSGFAQNVDKTCFILGDVHTLPITHQGGTFPLHPFGQCGGEQQVECCATLEAPPGVVGSGVTVSVHYAIILDGPFKFPEEWERTSVVLYINCPDSRFLVDQLKVDLCHWAVSSEMSHMCFMKSDHLLQYGQTKFTFQCHANVISSRPNVASVYLKNHFCLVCIAAAKSRTPSRYFGMLLSEPLHNGIQDFWLCITYGVPSWISAVREYYRRSEGSEQCPSIPQHKELQSSGNKVLLNTRNSEGPGWSLEVTKHEVLLTELELLSEPQYSDCKEKKLAFEMGCYPPSATFTAYYTSPPSPETHDQVPNVAYLLTEDSNRISFSFPVHNIKVAPLEVPRFPDQLLHDPVRIGWTKLPTVPSAGISDAANGPVQGAWTEPTNYNPPLDEHYSEPSKPLTVQNLMPYISDLADEVVSISGWLDMDRELKVIKRTPGIISPREQLQELLKKWLEDTECPTAPHTWEYFVRVVREVRKGHVAERIVGDVFTDSGLPSDPVALEKYVVSKMADNWYLFGIHLGLPEDTLKAIDKLKIKNSTRCLAMFQQWMEEIGPVENKMNKIEQAMKEVVKITESKVSSRTSTCEHQQGDEYSLSNDAIADWAKKMADSWLNFGIALGFSKEDLQTIKDLNDTGYSNSNEVCCSAMLYRWMETGDQREKTHERLLRAAKEANPLVVTNGMCPEPPPYSESQTSDLEVPPITLDT